MSFLKQSAQAYLDLGPFLDADDGITAKTALTITQAQVLLSKNGAAMAQKSDASALSHLSAGNYRCKLATADVNTCGRLSIRIHHDSALPVWEKITVLPPYVYDSLVAGTDNLQVDVTQVKGSAMSASVAQFGANVVNWKGAAAAAMTGDAFARLGAPAGASVSADLAAVKVDTAAVLVDTGTTLDGKISAIDAIVDAILVDTATTLDDKLDSIKVDTSAVAAVDFVALTSAIAAIDSAAITAMTESVSAMSAKVDQILVDTSAIAAIDFGALLSAVGAIDTSALAALSVDMSALSALVTEVGSQATAILADTSAMSGLPAAVAALPSAAGIKTALEAANSKLELLYRRFYGKVSMTSSLLTIYDDAGTAALKQQSLSDDGTTQTQGAAT